MVRAVPSAMPASRPAAAPTPTALRGSTTLLLRHHQQEGMPRKRRVLSTTAACVRVSGGQRSLESLATMGVAQSRQDALAGLAGLCKP